jgi:hypothetical protein
MRSWFALGPRYQDGGETPRHIYRPDGKLGGQDTMITKDKWPTVHKALPRAASSYGHGEWIVCANGG